ncbi:MAG: hypothetical protein BWX48_01048 [Verrucomicrobia bacterium ADurb.Bin006]|nr:MAG: hypothetical protein BWX48_01048 [Verrucomicrobia bacterium ADurb.Bin006]
MQAIALQPVESHVFFETGRSVHSLAEPVKDDAAISSASLELRLAIPQRLEERVGNGGARGE